MAATEYLDKAGLEYYTNKIKERYDKVDTLPGVIYQYAGGSLPDGFLWCDGSEVSRTEYSALFAAIGTLYGAGDGSTTFNVPNLNGRVPVGAGALGDGSGSFTIGNTGGEVSHLLTLNEMPRHKHALPYYSSNWDDKAQAAVNGVTYAKYTDTGVRILNASSYTDGTEEGSSVAHENMQPYIVVNYIISTGEETIDVKTIISAIQALPLGAEYGGTGTTSKQQFYSEYRLKRFESGEVQVTPSAANIPTLVSVTFDEPFDAEPDVLVTPETAVPGTIVVGCAYTNCTETGFDAVLTRTNTNTTTVHWMAIEK